MSGRSRSRAGTPVALAGACCVALTLIAGGTSPGRAATKPGAPTSSAPSRGHVQEVDLPATNRLSNGYQFNTRISADGTAVGFVASPQHNFRYVDEDYGIVSYPRRTTGFVWSRSTGTFSRVPVAHRVETDDTNSYVITPAGDGSHLALSEVVPNTSYYGTNVLQPAFDDVNDGRTKLPDVRRIYTTDVATISDSGRRMAFLGNDPHDDGELLVYVYDTETGSLRSIPGGDSLVQISASGRYVAFETGAGLAPEDTNDNRDVYVWDLVTDAVSLVTRPDPSAAPDPDDYWTFVSSQFVEPARLGISDNGRYVTYATDRSDLSADDVDQTFDVFLTDRFTGTTTLISPDINSPNLALDISANGRYVLFQNVHDVFRWDRNTKRTVVISRSEDGAPGNAPSFDGSMSRDGRSVAFTSNATNLTRGAGDGHSRVFLWTQNP